MTKSFLLLVFGGKINKYFFKCFCGTIDEHSARGLGLILDLGFLCPFLKPESTSDWLGIQKGKQSRKCLRSHVQNGNYGYGH